MNTIEFHHTDKLKEIIKARLERFESKSLNVSGRHDKGQLISAAVAVVISKQTNNGNACIYLTVRSSKLRKHAGQFALPGGKLDADETEQQAALRELDEELGLKLNSSQVLGQLDDFPTRSGFIITPVIIWNNTSVAITPNPDEVAKVYEIPLSELTNPDLLITEGSSANPMRSINLPTTGTTVYSPTAAMVYQFREVALLGKDTRVDDYQQPDFAHR